jgi:hypothetical protein
MLITLMGSNFRGQIPLVVLPGIAPTSPVLADDN